MIRKHDYRQRDGAIRIAVLLALLAPLGGALHAGETGLSTSQPTGPSPDGVFVSEVGIAWSPDLPKAGRTVTFTATPPGTFDCWCWRFGDKAEAPCTPDDCVEKNDPVSHVYENPGVYTVEVLAGVNSSASRNYSSAARDITVEPDCSYRLDPIERSFSDTGGSGSFDVSVSQGCLWEPMSTREWIEVDDSSRNGSSSVSYFVRPNTGPKRSGEISITEGVAFLVRQSESEDGHPSDCSLSIVPSNISISGFGGSGVVNVGASKNCEWSPKSNKPWVVVSDQGPFKGDGAFRYSARANRGDNERLGTISINDREVDLSQETIDVGACIAGETKHCFQRDRFSIEIEWRDFRGTAGKGRVVDFESDESGLFFFFNKENWEMLVKLLNGCSSNNYFWVLAAATTNVEYTLRVVDTVTDVTRDYFNPLGVAAPALTSTGAFSCSPMPSALAHLPEPLFQTDSSNNHNSLSTVPSIASPKANCTDSLVNLCLNEERFKVDVTWRDFKGESGIAQVVQFGSDDSGLFWFFNESNWEMLIKVLNGCALNGNYWVFAAATTNVEYNLRVIDTETGASKHYFNPPGLAASAITDTAAFSTCP